MPDNPGYKTEEELKQEAKLRARQEAENLARRPKTRLQQKRENFWYHYKWHTVAAVVALTLIGLLTKDILFRTTPDATVIMLSSHYFLQEELDEIASQIESDSRDFNGDGKVYIAIDFISLPSENMDPQSEMGATIKLTAVFTTAADPIFLLDNDGYQHLMRMGALSEESAEIGEHPISIFSDEKVSAASLSPLTENMYFYLRQPELFSNHEEYYNYCKELIAGVPDKVN